MATYLRRWARQSGLHGTATTLVFPAPVMILLIMLLRCCSELAGISSYASASSQIARLQGICPPLSLGPHYLVLTLNSTSMARPPSAANSVTTGHARAGGVMHQMKPMCQRSVGVGQPGCHQIGENFPYVFKGARSAPSGGWPPRRDGAARGKR